MKHRCELFIALLLHFTLFLGHVNLSSFLFRSRSFQNFKFVFFSYVCSITVISGAGIYRQTCESVFSPSKFKANVSFIAFVDCCSFVEIGPKWLHSILVLKRPAVKNIDEQLCKKVSFTLSDLIWTLRMEIEQID